MITVAEMSNHLELLKLVNIINELKIARKYLFATMDTFNATIFGKTTINFKVMINHKEKGMLLFHKYAGS